jgi:hypothetical protein
MHPKIPLARGRSRISAMARPFVEKDQRLALEMLQHMIAIANNGRCMQRSDIPKIRDDHMRPFTTQEMASVRRDVRHSLMATQPRVIAYSLEDYTSLKQSWVKRPIRHAVAAHRNQFACRESAELLR